MKNSNKGFAKLGILIIIIIVLILIGLKLFKNSDGNNDRATITKAAIEQNDPSMCEEISITSDVDANGVPTANTHLCYQDVAKAQNNVKVCDNIQSLDNQWRCYLEVSQSLKSDVSICATTGGLDCYGSFAKKAQDSSICDVATTAVSKGECYLQYVKTYPEKALCEKMPTIPENTFSGGNSKTYYKDACNKVVASKSQQ